MYSQNNEEAIIIAELNRLNLQRGRVLDIGAWDGKTYSNSLRLIELGWEAVCVEPSPFVFPKLVETHRNRPQVSLVNAAIGPVSKLVEWFDSGGDAVSTTSVAHRNKWEAGTALKFTPFWIYMLSVADFFNQFGTAFEVINIDVEGTNYDLFCAIPWESFTKTRIICIEHDTHHLDILKRMVLLGYRQIGFNGENLLLSRDHA